MTIEELIIRINAYADPDPDSDWKYGKNYGIMMAVQEVKRYANETHHGEQPEERTETHACDCISRK